MSDSLGKGRLSLPQFVTNVNYGDAITNHCLEIRTALREWGYRSEIYAQYIDPRLRGEATPYHHYADQATAIIFHFSIGAEIADSIQTREERLILIYHNITPPHFYEGVNDHLAALARRGRSQLRSLAPLADLALADSEFNRLELAEAGSLRTGVLPLIFNPSSYERKPDEKVLNRYDDGRTNLLFVGRIVPNKRQEDVIKVFYWYKKIDPGARLFLVGSFDGTERYYQWLRSFVSQLGLEDVYFCGHVEFQELLAFYRLADIFVCMSEHEGFCLPLLESMYFHLPIVAYASTAIPYTLGDAGVLIKEKRYDIVAEVVNLLATDEDLRHRVVVKQKERLREFERQKVLATLRSYLEEVLA